MTTENTPPVCPAEALMKALAGKWKGQIFQLASEGPVRFSELMKIIPGITRQSLSQALKELEGEEWIKKTVIRQKPLHIEYTLTEKGIQVIPVFKTLESIK